MRLNKLNMSTLKQQAASRWPEILTEVGGCPAGILDGNNHPCPKCGGVDRFRMIDREVGALFCNQCFNKKNGDGLAALAWLRDWDFATTKKELAKYLGTDQLTKACGEVQPQIVASYSYTDEQGKLLLQVCRREPGAHGEKKDFIQRRPKIGGGWEYKVTGTKLVPYRLQEMLAAPADVVALILEGEKDVDRAAGLGLIATTNADRKSVV